MIDGLGLAETTPGPLILVVEFVGFMGAYRAPGAWHPMVAGVAGAIAAVWSTFVPCFLWIFVGAPWVEALRASRALHAALTVVMAAVVGVILNLSVWFFLHAAFARVEEHRLGLLAVTLPVWSTVDVAMVVLAAGAMVALVRFKVGMGKTLAASALLGAAWRMWS
jgi:chromate transporter